MQGFLNLRISICILWEERTSYLHEQHEHYWFIDEDKYMVWSEFLEY